MNKELLKRLATMTFPVEAETWPRLESPKMVCLHHTASGPGVDGDVNWWKSDGQPVSTPIVVGREGIAFQLYSSMRWAFNLGLQAANYKQIEAMTIGVEIDTWGALNYNKGVFTSWTGAVVPKEDVCILESHHRGYRYFHKYTPAQIETVRLLLLHWNETYGIPLDYKGSEIFELSQNARSGTRPGIYSHNSFRSDKTDIHPQPDMIAMLKGLKK